MALVMSKSRSDEYPPDVAARRRDDALRVAFTLPHKPHAKSSPKGKKARGKQPGGAKAKKR